MAAPNSLVLQRSYRQLGVDGHAHARRFLEVADDALHMALLTLDGPPDDSWEAKLRRAATARRPGAKPCARAPQRHKSGRFVPKRCP